MQIGSAIGCKMCNKRVVLQLQPRASASAASAKGNSAAQLLTGTVGLGWMRRTGCIALQAS